MRQKQLGYKLLTRSTLPLFIIGDLDECVVLTFPRPTNPDLKPDPCNGDSAFTYLEEAHSGTRLLFPAVG
jgi:hypothetical protein